MIRYDGDFTIYRIQRLWKGKGKWVGSIENEKYFPVSHKCWQTTGIHGTFNLEEAKEVLGKAVAQLDKDRTFRLVEITISQSTKVLYPSY